MTFMITVRLVHIGFLGIKKAEDANLQVARQVSAVYVSLSSRMMFSLRSRAASHPSGAGAPREHGTSRDAQSRLPGFARGSVDR
jgi:hypothetical protein